jgi:site-specific DNA-methyltransferase (adenine-specific)
MIRDSIVTFLEALDDEASLKQIHNAVVAKLGSVSDSSIRSYLGLNEGRLFERTRRGRYRLVTSIPANDRNGHTAQFPPALVWGKAKLYRGDCFDWLSRRGEKTVHAVVTDPPYGLTEYTQPELTKLRNGRGGVWRIPPSFDGHQRSPLPRFTIMTEEDRRELYVFFKRLGALAAKVLVPGGNVIVATNPLLQHIVASAMSEGGLELRGSLARLTMTMRGGDRPKNAHEEFKNVSVMPRSQWEPWVVLRRPIEGRVQDNLRKYQTGGFRRLSDDRPFGDVIPSKPTSATERKIAPHPSLKPQDFLRQVVRASLPLGEGIVLDPFAGSGSTLAAANAVGYESIGVEADLEYVRLASEAIPALAKLKLAGASTPDETAEGPATDTA